MPDISILVVDKNPEYLALLEQYTTAAALGNKLVKKMQQVSETGLELALLSGDYRIAFVDYETVAKLCNGHVARWLKSIRLQSNCSQIVIISATGDELLAVKMILAGAADYIPKRLLSPRLVEIAVKLAWSRSSSEIDSKQGRAKRDEVAGSTPVGDAATIGVPLFRDRDIVARALPRKPQVTIDGYEISRELSRSVDTVLYLAKSHELQDLVVLKLIKLTDADELALPRFEREYATVSKINHPLVVDIYDFGVIGNHAYIAMEYFPCGDLKNRMANPISPHQSLNYLKHITQGLEQLHQRDIVHLDLKPANIMLREDNSIALIDFGIAIAGDSHVITNFEEIHGTPYYISPEQVKAEPVDHRSDIYALGIIFFEMLTGQKPFSGKTANDIVWQHVRNSPPRLSTELEAFQGLLDLFLAKKPDCRFQNTSQIIQGIDSLGLES